MGVARFSFRPIAHGQSRKPNVYSWGRARCDDGVGEVNTTQCGVAAAALTVAGLVEMRPVKVVGFSI
jgi:hypothetical protein